MMEHGMTVVIIDSLVSHLCQLLLLASVAEGGEVHPVAANPVFPIVTQVAFGPGLHAQAEVLGDIVHARAGEPKNIGTITISISASGTI
jgi:hypothetical protein